MATIKEVLVRIDGDLAKVQKLCLQGLDTDGAHHKQWYLERILEIVIGEDEFESRKGMWEEGIVP